LLYHGAQKITPLQAGVWAEVFDSVSGLREARAQQNGRISFHEGCGYPFCFLIAAWKAGKYLKAVRELRMHLI
jgi:hypothetical protein